MKKTKEGAPLGEETQPLKCWLVEITLTSGEDLQFYVTAKDEFMAYKKADEYSIMVENQDVLNWFKEKGFSLFP